MSLHSGTVGGRDDTDILPRAAPPRIISPMFERFTVTNVMTPRGSVCVRVGGSGPPVLVLHGYPETHLMWHAVAQARAERFPVIAAALPGYGASSRPPVTDDHAGHAKRALAADFVAAMRELGHGSFALVGHDRGGR